jgi:flagella synthesis protein FlgN
MSTALLQCLERETELVEAFITAVDAETAALMDRTAHEALAEAARTKETLAEQLVELSGRRDALLAEIGLPDGHKGTEQAVARFPEIAPVWKHLQKRVVAAREGNDRNASIINVSLRYTEQSLEALRKIAQQANNVSTYDAQGRGSRGGYGMRDIVAR